MEGVVYEFVEEANKAPPVIASYQSIVPAEAVAPSVTEPVPQTKSGWVEVMLGTTSMVAFTAVRLVEIQVPSLASA